MDSQLKERIDQWVKNNSVVLFVKGTKQFPQCGFSAAVIAIFKELGVPFETVNVLADQEVRQGLKEYSNWPTFPQVYVNGEFIGGCDIVRDMHAKGELKPLLSPANT